MTVYWFKVEKAEHPPKGYSKFTTYWIQIEAGKDEDAITKANEYTQVKRLPAPSKGYRVTALGYPEPLW